VQEANETSYWLELLIEADSVERVGGGRRVPFGCGRRPPPKFHTMRCDGKSGLSDCSPRRDKPWTEPAVSPAVPYAALRQGNKP